MLFNSLDFAIFLPLVFSLYWVMNGMPLRYQNLFLVAASYLFYGWWDWRFLILILFTSSLDFIISRGLSEIGHPGKRKALLSISIITDLGILGFFKYFNFFQENFIAAFTFFGHPIQGNSLNIILPVGISFYTFQSLSYTIDVYRRKMKPSENLVDFLAFVSFFPQLVAGPIERASHLLPQFYRKRKFEYTQAMDGVRQILWGLFKKIVIADNCAIYANQIFNNSGEYSGSTLLVGALFFTFQIYGDFSGYSDIAIGTARLFGFDLMKNFAFPYFSRDVAEFWRRWHISLSTWFRDYLYIPLGGSRNGTWKSIRNTFIIFMVSGFWHGANWTFIVWGALNALYFLPLMLTNNNRKNLSHVAEGKILPSFKELIQIISTFSLTVLAWVFFRADNISHAIAYLSTIASPSLFTIPVFDGRLRALRTIVILIIFILIEWKGREKEYAIQQNSEKYQPLHTAIIAYAILLGIILFGNTGTAVEFIYFQF